MVPRRTVKKQNTKNRPAEGSLRMTDCTFVGESTLPPPSQEKKKKKNSIVTIHIHYKKQKNPRLSLSDFRAIFAGDENEIVCVVG